MGSTKLVLELMMWLGSSRGGAAATKPDASRYLQPVGRSIASGASDDRANQLHVNLGYGSAHKENPVGLDPVEIDPTDRRSSEMRVAAAQSTATGTVLVHLPRQKKTSVAEGFSQHDFCCKSDNDG